MVPTVAAGRAAVQGHEVEIGAETANRDAAAFAVHAIDGHAGDSLQRFSEVRVREFADVLGRDRIDDTGRILLDVHRRFQAAADTGDDDFLQLVRLLVLLGERRVDEHHATDDGEECL